MSNREQWIATSHSHTRFSVGILGVPVFKLGDQYDLLLYAEKEDIEQSMGLKTALDNGWLTIAKTRDGGSVGTVDTDTSGIQIAEEDETSGTGGGDLATIPESNAGVITDKAVTPAGLLFIQPTSGTGTGLLGGGNRTNDPLGDLAIDIQTDRSSADEAATGDESVAIGSYCKASGFDSIAIGDSSYALADSSLATNGGVVDVGADSGIAIGGIVAAGADHGIAIGANSDSTGSYGIAIGGGAGAAVDAISMGEDSAAGTEAIALGLSASAGTNAVAIGSSAIASGARDVLIGYSATVDLTSGGENTGIGYGVTLDNTTARGVALGYFAYVNANNSSAIGSGARVVIAGATNITGPIFCRKDNGESAGNAMQVFSGTEVVVMTKEVSLKATGTQTLTVPTGSTFFLTEVGVISTIQTGSGTQPTVSFGITGTLAKYLAATVTTTLTAAGKRQRFTSLLVPEDGATTLAATITSASTYTTHSGRFYFKGILIEDE
jgi:hypothetical protein